jgi:hypothetical protein
MGLIAKGELDLVRGRDASPRAPRTDPYVRLSRIRLPPWVTAAVSRRMRANALCHACPALSPARAELARIPLGPRPSLDRLRRGSLRFVRRLLSYYGKVRLLVPVHHWLRLLTFPMRASNGNAVPVRHETSQLPMRSLCT